MASRRPADDPRWASVLRRDRAADGRFFYAVTSTGVFCRPSCPSRRPLRVRVLFFETAEAAQSAGFRACRRCDPTGASASPAESAVTRAVDYLTVHAEEAVTLAVLARAAGISPFHLQRRFKQVLGVSPREFQAARRAERFRLALRQGQDVTTATYAAGYGSPSRVSDAAPTGRGMSPARYRHGGEGDVVGFVTLRCALGWLLVAATARGVCSVRLGDASAALQDELRREFPRAEVVEGGPLKAAWVRAVVQHVSGGSRETTVPLDARGTAFQWRVWRALQEIPPGETRSYADVAAAIGAPAAARAVARACATNPVGLLVPCHRVIAKDGALGGYRWGVARKRRLLEAEKKRSRIRAE